MSLAARAGFGLVASFAALVVAQSVSAVTIWDELFNGDLSNDRSNPTALSLSVGTNTIVGSVTAGERDYFRINVPSGNAFNQLILSAYAPNNLGFFAIQSGTQVTVDPAAPTAAPLLGWVHTDTSLVGSDILDDMGAATIPPFAAIGFTPPLGPGDYSFWMQQTNPTLTTYTFDLIVVPEPSVAALLFLGLAALALARRRA